MDERDEAIISYLVDHGNASTRDISEATDIPVSTVHQRKAQLEDKGVIESYTIDADWEAVGYGFHAAVLMTVDLSQLRRQGLQQDDLVEALREISAVEEARIVTGAYDVLISVRAHDKDSFNDVLQGEVQQLTGVSDTTTLISLN
jgi:DNA-binding Lrp family transcriptional regulator